MRKSIFGAVTALLLAVTLCVPVCAGNGETVYASGFFRYTLNDGTATIVRYAGNEEEVIVPSSFGSNTPVYAVARGAFADNPYVKVIYLPGTVRVEYGAFSPDQKTPKGAVFSVEKTAEGTDVEIFCAVPGGAVWCAAYDGDGRMLGAESRSVIDGQSVYRFSFGTENRVKAFLLDADWQPLCESKIK